MKRNLIIFFVIGLIVGGLAGWQVDAQLLNKPATLPISSVPAGFKTVTVAIPGGGLVITIRETDQVSRLKTEDKIIGYKIVDAFAPQSGAAVDIITERLAEFYDRPEATELAAYKEAISGLTLRETRDITIGGHPALKQLYDASIAQKRSDGVSIKKPSTNLLRYVIAGGPKQFLLLKSPAPFQKYLDTIALSIRFVAAPKTGAENVINLGSDGTINDVLPTENPQINGGDVLPL